MQIAICIKEPRINSEISEYYIIFLLYKLTQTKECQRQ